MTTLPGFRMNDDDEENQGPDRSTAAMMTKFLEARTVLLFGPVDQKVSERIATQLLYLDHLSTEPITAATMPEKRITSSCGKAEWAASTAGV